MAPYLGLLVYCFTLAALSILSRSTTDGSGQQVRSDPFQMVLLAGLVVFMGFRFEVGTDYHLYSGLYRRLNPDFWAYFVSTSPQEVGFTTLSLATRTWSETPRVVFVICAAVTVVASYLAFKRASQEPVLSVLLFVLVGHYLSGFNITRQLVAVSLVMLAVVTWRRSRGGAFALVVLAALFHLSALPAFLAILAVRHVPANFRSFGLVVGGSAVAAALFGRGNALGAIVGAINPRYEAYLALDPGGLGSYLLLLHRLALIAAGLYLLKRSAPGVREANGAFAAISLLSIPFLAIGTQSTVVARLELYFSVFLAILLVNLCVAQWKRGGSLWFGVITLSGLAYFVAHLASFGDLLPYQWSAR